MSVGVMLQPLTDTLSVTAMSISYNTAVLLQFRCKIFLLQTIIILAFKNPVSVNFDPE